MLSALLFGMLLLGPAAAINHGELYRLVPELSILTTFAHDYGDSISKVTYKGTDYAPGEATAKILPLLGWPDRVDKLELGVAWAKAFGLYGFEVLTRDHYLYRDGIAEPVAEFLPDGTFRYTAWVANLRGREPGGVSLRAVEITPEAVLTVTPMAPRLRLDSVRLLRQPPKLLCIDSAMIQGVEAPSWQGRPSA